MYLEMNFKKFSLVTVFLLTLALFVPKASVAADTIKFETPEVLILVKIQEGIKYFFTFKTENKISVLEENAEKRLVWAKSYADTGNDGGVQSMIQSYLQIKEKQDGLLGKVDGQVLGIVEERTIEQQKTMEEIKTKTGDEIKNEVIQVQERVVNQVAERIVVVGGTEGQTEFFKKVEHVWAPGTEPKDGKSGTSGVVIEGGTMQFAPGTSAGKPLINDIRTVEIKTGGVLKDDLPPGVTRGDGGTAVDSFAPGTGNTMGPGGVDIDGPNGATNVIAP